jgi:hypothetical protein
VPAHRPNDFALLDRWPPVPDSLGLSAAGSLDR